MAFIQSVFSRKDSGRIWIGLLLSLIIIGAVTVISIVLSEKEKEVHLIVNGEQMTVETVANTVVELIEEEDLRVGEYDSISKSLNETIEDGDQIQIDLAKAVQLIDRDDLQIRYTTRETVAEALADWGITVGVHDELYPSLDEKIEENDTIQIVRVAYTYEKEIEEIPYETIEQPSKQLVKGKKMIETYGKNGEKEKTIQKVWKNGTLATEKVVDEKVLSKSVDQVVAVGTKSEVQVLSASSQNIDYVTKDGVTFGVKSIFENVTLTAYDAGVNSTGKSKGHPQYGITYTGTVVKEGRTAAVDPKVIPLGWWIYIEGYGFRKAEDIGGAVKGKKIDIYVESEEEANKFGTKKGYTVYVIGPEKPAGID